MSGILYLVSIPMGDDRELSSRAADVLIQADALVCEEWKTGRSLIKRLGLQDQKELFRLNEHNVKESTTELLGLLKQGKTLALFSDSGAPVFADPGAELVKLCYRNNIAIKHVSGPSSLISALVVCGFTIEPFLYMGWLPRKPEERNRALTRLKQDNTTAIIMETPYRLMAMLESIKQALGPDRLIAVCCNLTAKNEHIQRGTVLEVIKYFEQHPEKPEFVLVIGGLNEKL